MQGTLARNIGLRAKSPRELTDLLEHCGVTSELLGTYAHEDFRIREAGANVGSSLHMRILLARALAGQPWVLLVDDFDRIRDPLVSQRIRELWEGADDITLVMVTQSEAIRATADQVWRIEPIDPVDEAPDASRPSKESIHEAA